MPHISKTTIYLKRNVIPWILVSCDTKSDLKVYVGQFNLHCIFHGPVIMPYISKTDREMSWILVPCDMKSDLKIYLVQCDLYFMHK